MAEVDYGSVEGEGAEWSMNGGGGGGVNSRGHSLVPTSQVWDRWSVVGSGIRGSHITIFDN